MPGPMRWVVVGILFQPFFVAFYEIAPLFLKKGGEKPQVIHYKPH